MNYNFYASRTDKLELLEFIFKETDLQVFDLSSLYGKEICEYKRLADISSKFDLEHGNKFAVTFQLWSPRHKGKPVFRKIKLDPKRCEGNTFRYATDGWGLIQLYFGGLANNQLSQSHIGHFSEKRALKLEEHNSLNGKIDAWDWSEIQKTSSLLKRYIHHKLAIKKQGNLGILSAAEELVAKGVKLV